MGGELSLSFLGRSEGIGFEAHHRQQGEGEHDQRDVPCRHQVVKKASSPPAGRRRTSSRASRDPGPGGAPLCERGSTRVSPAALEGTRTTRGGRLDAHGGQHAFGALRSEHRDAVPGPTGHGTERPLPARRPGLGGRHRVLVPVSFRKTKRAGSWTTASSR